LANTRKFTRSCAVTIARSLSDTFAGIRPIDVPLFVVAQFAGGLAATFLFRWMVPALPSAKDVVVAKEVVDVFFTSPSDAAKPKWNT